MMHLSLIFLQVLILSVLIGCEKVDPTVDPVGEVSQSFEPLSQRSEINPLIGDSTILSLARLATVDNLILMSYLDHSLDTSDVYAILNQLSVTQEKWFPDEYPNGSSMSKVIDFVDSSYFDLGLGYYLEEILSNQEVLFSKYNNYFSQYSNDQLLVWTEEAFESAIKEQNSAFTNLSNQSLSARSSSCEGCYFQYNDCTNASAAATITAGTVLAGGIITWTGYSGPPSWGAAGIAFAGGVLGAGFGYAYNASNCAWQLNRCLTRHECPGGGTSGEGNGRRIMLFVFPR